MSKHKIANHRVVRIAARFAVVCCFAVLLSESSLGANSSKYDVGVYYFPGWRDAPPLVKAHPWNLIMRFPDRKPLLGWYEDGDPVVAAQHLRWMHDVGINFVIYDWYWLNDSGVALDHALKAYLQSPERRMVKFALLWANHSGVPSSTSQFEEVVRYWVRHYFVHKSYYRVGGKPVVFVFSPSFLDRDARQFGSTSQQLLVRAREIALSEGISGIYFVACTQAVASQVQIALPRDGYNAVSAYNYHFGLSGKEDGRALSASYDELQDGYAESWRWIVTNSTLPYFVPVTVGWDKRAWGGSSQASHDLSFSTPMAFRGHLLRARALIDEYPARTNKTVVICCWNEFGEGSFIEPTEKYLDAYLKQVKAVFGPSERQRK